MGKAEKREKEAAYEKLKSLGIHIKDEKLRKSAGSNKQSSEIKQYVNLISERALDKKNEKIEAKEYGKVKDKDLKRHLMLVKLKEVYKGG